MRTRTLAGVTAGLTALTATAALAAPGLANAAPIHNRGLTIAASPNPITAGEGVLIYGQLKGANVANRRIVLYHRVDPAARFSPISMTRTNASGFYEFVRADGVVVSNRNWFVAGPGFSHSRTIHERVASVVSLNANATTATTAQQVNFSGTVYPNHPHQVVLLQEQDSSFGNGWRTVASTVTAANSSFMLDHRFKTAGSYTLRAYFPRDVRNLAGESATVNLTVDQQQNPSFTITGSAAIVTDGQPVTISGTLYQAGSTTSVQANVPVTLYGRTAYGKFRALAGGSTNGSGQYSFTQVPLNNTVYRVETAGGTPAMTAELFVGVEDAVTINQSATTIPIGDTVTISGTVTPQHSGHVISLQQLNPSTGHWFDVMTGAVAANSTYSFTYAPGELGALQLRVQITGGPANVGSDSSPVTVTVAGVAPVSSLPAAS